MRLTPLTSLPVARLDWSDPSPVSTLIVKATFHVDERGRAVPTRHQLPIAVDHADAGWPVDMVPRKRGADVLVVGAARSPSPTDHIAVRVTTQAFDIAVSAVAGAATTEIPLIAHYLRGAHPGEDVRLDARPPHVEGWASRAVDAAFDFAQFNAAVAAHRAEAIPLGSQMLTAGIFTGAPTTVLLPRLAPHLFLVASPGSEGAPVPLTCDTLVLDSDGHRIVLTWRGTVPRPPPTASLVVTLAHHRRPPPWTELAPQVDGVSVVDTVGDGPAGDDALVDEETAWPEGAAPVATPFVPGRPPPRAADDLPYLGDEGDEYEGGTEAVQDVAEARRKAMAALPFAAQAPASTEAPASSPWSSAAARPAAPPPRSPAGAPLPLPRPPAPRAPRLPPRSPSAASGKGPPGGSGGEPLDLERYAAIKAALAASDRPLADVLAGFEIPPAAWHEHERVQARRLARDAADGGGLGKRLRAAVTRARRGLDESHRREEAS